MVAPFIFGGIYLLSAAIVGALHWAKYQDVKKTEEVTMEAKAMNLYILPLCPVVNSMVALQIITSYFEI